MKKISVGSRDRIDLKDANVKGIAFNFYAAGDTNNTAIVEESLDFDSILIDVKLQQNGKQIGIYSGPLGVVCEESSFFESRYNYIKPVTRTANVMLAPGAANKPIQLIPLYLDFGTVINLDGDDKLTIDVRVESSLIAAAAKVDSATSFLYVEAIEGIGVQYITPQINITSVQGSEQNLKLNLGDNIQNVCFINRDKTSILAADDVISTVRISSDRLNIQDTHMDLVAKRYSQFSTTAEADARLNSFMLTEKETDKTVIEITFTAANVTAAKNFVVVRSFITDSSLVGKAERKAQKHSRVAMSKIY